jgi:dephospho-CoA kinase
MAGLRIGLTGGIGSGKSTVATAWGGLGATLVDTDAIAHALCAPGGAALPALRSTFGDAIQAPDGGLDRGRMREMAFADPLTRRRLETILHPLIGEEALRQAAQVSGTVVFDVPLLTESTLWRGRCDRIAVVDCRRETQVARVVARSGWTPEQVERVIAQQAPRSRRRAVADAVIHNDGITVDELRDLALALWAYWHSMPGERRWPGL